MQAFKRKVGVPMIHVSPEDIDYLTKFTAGLNLILHGENCNSGSDPCETESYCYVSKEKLEELLGKATGGEIKATSWFKMIVQTFYM
ncbi:hypothetical protein MC885_017915, partial [Smutsia gigantea]